MATIDLTALARALTAQGCDCSPGEPLARHTSFRIGGPAGLFIRPHSAEQAARALALCREAGTTPLVMGNGSNLLVRDEGVDGPVLTFGREMSAITREGNDLIAQCGATLSQLCAVARDAELAGLEFAYGIPGSVGGGVFMNAGAYGGEMKDVVSAVFVLDQQGQEHEIPAAEAGFAYRTSRFQQENLVVTAARFTLLPGDRAAIDAAMRDVMERRGAKQPLELPSAGSFFKRPPGHYAAALIEQCGLKGLRVGDAMVSEKHSGFVVNVGAATCADVLALSEEISRRVLDATGVTLEREVRLV